MGLCNCTIRKSGILKAEITAQTLVHQVLIERSKRDFLNERARQLGLDVAQLEHKQ